MVINWICAMIIAPIIFCPRYDIKLSIILMNTFIYQDKQSINRGEINV